MTRGMAPAGRGRAYPQRPIVGVAAVIFEGDQALLVRRGREPGRGQWSLPGGAVELGETVVEALRREVREELSIEITIGGLLGVYDRIFNDADGRIAYHYVLIDYWAERLSGVPSPGSDVDALRLVGPRHRSELALDPELEQALTLAERLRLTGA